MNCSISNPVTLQLFVLGGLILYMIIGAVIFHNLESENKSTSTKLEPLEFTVNFSKCFIKSLDRAKSKVVTDDSNLIEMKSCLLSTNEPKELADWSFSSALLFTFTVVTTIGYGHVSPETFGGRMFFIFYSLIGIPITLIFLANIGKFMIEGAKSLIHKLKSHFSRHKRRNNQKTDDEEISTGALFIGGFVLYTVLGSVTLPYYEQMGYFDAFYFIFVSLTTIGLGDYYPKNASTIFLFFLYMSIGLALTSITIDFLSYYLRKLHHFGRKLASMANVQVWFGDKKATVSSIVGVFADEHNIPRPTEEELEKLVNDAVAETSMRPQQINRAVVQHLQRKSDFEQNLPLNMEFDSEPEVDPSPLLFDQIMFVDESEKTVSSPESQEKTEPEQTATRPMAASILGALGLTVQTESKVPQLMNETVAELSPGMTNSKSSLESIEWNLSQQPMAINIKQQERLPQKMMQTITLSECTSQTDTPQQLGIKLDTPAVPVSQPDSEPVLLQPQKPQLQLKSQTEYKTEHDSPEEQKSKRRTARVQPVQKHPEAMMEKETKEKEQSSSQEPSRTRHGLNQNKEIFNAGKSVTVSGGKIKHDPAKRYEQFQKEWSKFKSPGISKNSIAKEKKT